MSLCNLEQHFREESSIAMWPSRESRLTAGIQRTPSLGSSRTFMVMQVNMAPSQSGAEERLELREGYRD